MKSGKLTFVLSVESLTGVSFGNSDLNSSSTSEALESVARDRVRDKGHEMVKNKGLQKGASISDRRAPHGTTYT